MAGVQAELVLGDQLPGLEKNTVAAMFFHFILFIAIFASAINADSRKSFSIIVV